MRPLRRATLLTLATAMTLVAARAEAEPSADDRALATALFQKGKALLAEGRIDEACEKLAESQRLDPGGGTLLNLALCREQEGRLASAWSEFSEARSAAKRDGRKDREDAAGAHVAALEPRLSTLTLDVPPSAQIAGLTIARDHGELGRGSWSLAMPIDGGDHEIEVSAPGKRAVTLHVHLGPERDHQSISIPVLVDAPKPSGPSRARGAQRILGFSLGAAGIVEAGIGIFFGARAIGQHADSNTACPMSRCSSGAVTLEDNAGRAADASTALFALGVASAALGVTLVLTAPPKPVVTVTGTPAGVSLVGRF